MIVPAQAIVRPHVFITDADSPLPLGDEIGERIERGDTGLIELAGAAGSGKSTALAHLAYLHADNPHLLLRDDPDTAELAQLRDAAADRLVLCSVAERVSATEGAVRWRLAPWTQDAWIEYLLAAHHDRCASVMRRVLANRNRAALGGCPELWRAVLDRLAEDESIVDLNSALRSAVSERLQTDDACSAARKYSLIALKIDMSADSRSTKSASDGTLDFPELDGHALLLLRHFRTQVLLAADCLAEALAHERGQACLGANCPRRSFERPRL